MNRAIGAKGTSLGQRPGCRTKIYTTALKGRKGPAPFQGAQRGMNS